MGNYTKRQVAEFLVNAGHADAAVDLLMGNLSGTPGGVADDGEDAPAPEKPALRTIAGKNGQSIVPPHALAALSNEEQLELKVRDPGLYRRSVEALNDGPETTHTVAR